MMNLFSPCGKYFLVVHDQSFKIERFCIKSLGLSLSHHATIRFLSELSVTMSGFLSASAYILIKEKEKNLYLWGVITRITRSHQASPVGYGMFECVMTSVLFAQLQSMINVVYPLFNSKSFVQHFLADHGFERTSYELSIKQAVNERYHVARNEMAYDMFIQALAEERIFFASRFNANGERLLISDCMKTFDDEALHTADDVMSFETSCAIQKDNQMLCTYHLLTHYVDYSPGQSLIYDDDVFRIINIDIVAQQSVAFSRDKTPQREQPSCETRLTLQSIGDVPFIDKRKKKRSILCQSGKIESLTPAYFPMNSQGLYRVRLNFDSESAETGCLSERKKSCVFPGAMCGGDFPLEDKTNVLLVCDSGSLEKAMILGALPIRSQTPLVNNTHAYDNVIKTSGGQRLLMCDVNTGPFIELSSYQQENALLLSPGFVSVRSEVGNIEFLSGGDYTVHCAESCRYLSEKNIVMRVGQSIRIVGDNVESTFQSAHKMYMLSDTSINVDAQEMKIEAKEHIKWHATQAISWQSKRMHLESSMGDVNVVGKTLTIHADEIIWRCGTSIMTINAGTLSISALKSHIKGPVTVISS